MKISKTSHPSLEDFALNCNSQSLDVSQSIIEALLFRCFAEEINDIVWEGDHHIVLRYVNSKAREIWGYEPEEIIGKPFADFMLTEKREGNIEIIQKMIDAKASVNGIHLYFRHKNGSELIFQTRAKPIFNNKGYCIGHRGIFRDVTNYIRQKGELEQLYEREQRIREKLQNQIQQRIDFTRALVHELKTPLTALQTANEILSEHAKNEPILTISESIHRSVNKLDKRIGDLLDIAKGELGILKIKCGRVKTATFLDGIINDITTVISKKSKGLVLDLAGDLPDVWVDEERISQVIWNMISNAIKFTPKNGEIRLKVYTEDNYVVFEISDNGRGISKRQQGQLFNSYPSIHNKQGHLGGLGLGLALSKTLVELHHGEIWVESKIRQGSTFTFKLPITPCKAR